MKINLENIGVRYMIGDFRHLGIKDVVIQKLKGLYNATEFWAVDGVSFQLEKGDFLGIVGKNGAGKSTLLKAVSGVMQPTRGKMTVEGTVAAFLELGTGFDGDMTVRENTFLRGALMGYTREFLYETYDEIIAFAELEDYQDRAFKHLSTGMRGRLAFSIACLVQPEILILDEVLAAGDGSFKVKSETRMKEIIAGGAATLLVSHSTSQIRSMCNKALWLHRGKQVAFGEAAEVVTQYENFLKGELLPEEIAVL